MIRLVLTTFASSEEAAGVVRTLVEEKLAACGTILPQARSIYSWQGQIEDTAEVVAIFKTAGDRLHEFKERLEILHPYDTPEIVVLNPENVSEKYANWVLGNTRA